MPLNVEKLVDSSVIRLLLTIAETGRFAAAAAALGITPPSVSQQVRRIEEFVGRPLFRRTRRGVELTEDGKAVVVYARAILGLADELRERLEGSDRIGQVSAGMSEDFCRTALPAVLRLFALTHPNVHLRVVSGTYDVLAAALENRSVDFAFMRRYEGFPEFEPVYKDQLVWIGGRGLRLPLIDPVPLILPLSPNPSRDAMIDCLHAAGRPFVVRFESVGIAGMEMALGANLGVCAGPRAIPLLGAAPLPAGHGLPPLPPVEYVMVRGGAELSRVARTFAEVMMEAARSRFSMMADARTNALRLFDPGAASRPQR